MADIDWTAIILGILGGGGSVATIAVAVIYARRPRFPKAVEDQATLDLHTPASPGGDDNKVTGLVSLANEIGVLSAQVQEHSAELGKVKRELSMFRRSYNALYWWAQRIINDWDQLREDANPPELPPDIHHPE